MDVMSPLYRFNVQKDVREYKRHFVFNCIGL